MLKVEDGEEEGEEEEEEEGESAKKGIKVTSMPS